MDFFCNMFRDGAIFDTDPQGDVGGKTFGKPVCPVSPLACAHSLPGQGGDTTGSCAWRRLGTAYEVFSSSFTPASDQRRPSSSLMCHGKNRSPSSGGAPPAAAHAVRYAVNHARGFNSPQHSVCT